MKIIVTGANGQLGADLVEILKTKHDVYGYSHNELDITNFQECIRVMELVKPDAVIHCAAYTAVDLAEVEQDRAYLVNGIGSRNVALATESVGAKLCLISTDYVFKGDNTKPYKEYDVLDPQSVYGKSKRMGEEMVSTFNSKHFIVRTSWVFGVNGNNFVKTMIKLSKNHGELKVVHDQLGSPTYTVDLSIFLSELIESDFYGIYHATNSGQCTWFEFANAIFSEYEVDIKVIPCETKDFPRPAPRPAFSVLDPMMIRINGFNELRNWREALKEFVSLNKYNL